MTGDRKGAAVERQATSTMRNVEQEMLDSLTGVTLDPDAINSKVQEMEERLGEGVYAELLYVLCHLQFPPQDAREHWNAVLEHQSDLQERLGQEVDFRVALLDYFVSVNHKLQNPKIIEIKIFQKTQESAYKDDLSGLYNSRYFRLELAHEIQKAERTGEPLSLLLFDVDHFKWYNDRNGHLQGDRALEAIGGVLNDEARATDLAARYGGEEFVLLLPGTAKPQAYQVADRVRRRISEHPFPDGDQQPLGRFSVSCGVATYRSDASDDVTLVDAADRALYLAKGSGRDRVMVVGTECRNFQRVPAAIPGRLQAVCNEEIPFATTNLSEQGFQFQCQAVVRQGEYFRFVLSLPEQEETLEGLARAVRVVQDGPICEVGARIMELPYPERQALRQYLDGRGQTTPEAAVSCETV